MKATRMRHGWVHMFITHRLTLTLQLHNFDLFRTCRTRVSALLRGYWQDFNWHDASRGPSAIAELLVSSVVASFWAHAKIASRIVSYLILILTEILQSHGTGGPVAQFLVTTKLWKRVFLGAYQYLYGMQIIPSFSANPSHRSLSFSSSGFTTWIPQTVHCYSWAYSGFYFLVFFCFYAFQLSLPCGRLSWLMLSFERTLK